MNKRKVYKQMKKEAIAVLNGKDGYNCNCNYTTYETTSNNLWSFYSDDGTIQEIKNNRIPQLMDILEEVEGKAVIWAHYRYDIEKIVEAISKKYGNNSVVTYYGDTTTDERQKAIKKYKTKNHQLDL